MKLTHHVITLLATAIATSRLVIMIVLLLTWVCDRGHNYFEYL